MTTFRSTICDRSCEHNHRTQEAAELCARERINAGEPRRYLGHDIDLEAQADEMGCDPIGMYVARFVDGIRVRG